MTFRLSELIYQVVDWVYEQRNERIRTQQAMVDGNCFYVYGRGLYDCFKGKGK